MDLQKINKLMTDLNINKIQFNKKRRNALTYEESLKILKDY